MIELPVVRGVAVLRTDFSNHDVWRDVESQLEAEDYNGSGCQANLTSVDRPDLTGLSQTEIEAQIPRKYPSGYERAFVIVVDAEAIANPEHPVLLIDLHEADTSPSFRALPREIASIEANLSIANMDFSDFGDSTGPDRVFRGFG